MHWRKNSANFAKDLVAFILLNAQQCTEKLHVERTSLILARDIDDGIFDLESGHQCNLCDYELCEKGAEISDNLEHMEATLSKYIKMVLVYIARYITRKNKDNSKSDTYFYFEKYGDHTKELNRGGLRIPIDHTCQWLFFCFILFHTLKENVS